MEFFGEGFSFGIFAWQVFNILFGLLIAALIYLFVKKYILNKNKKA